MQQASREMWSISHTTNELRWLAPAGMPIRERPRRTGSACIERISTITDAD